MPTAQLVDPEGLIVTFSVKGGYSPDVMHDLKNRMLEAYKEAFEFRYTYLADTAEVEPEDVD